MTQDELREKIKGVLEEKLKNKPETFYLKSIHWYDNKCGLPPRRTAVIGYDVTEALEPLIEPLMDPDDGSINRIILGVLKKGDESYEDIQGRKVQVFIEYYKAHYLEMAGTYNSWDWMTLENLLEDNYQQKLEIVKQKIIEWLSK